VVLELPDGQVLLYDAGQLGSPGVAARTVAGYLWSRGHTHVDAIVVSHADLDHFNGIPELCQRISIGGVLVSPMMFEQRRGSLLALDFALREAGIPRMTVSAGDRLKTGQDCRIEVFHPTRQGVLASDNANSVVLAVEYAGRRLLLTGDLESPGLEAVLAEEPYDCDVLLAPHHGSANSNPQGIARWCSPEWVIISGGHDVEGGVIDAYRAAGAESLHTAAVGAITITVTRQAMRVETFR
jgi:competence protein ComEC